MLHRLCQAHCVDIDMVMVMTGVLYHCAWHGIVSPTKGYTRADVVIIVLHHHSLHVSTLIDPAVNRAILQCNLWR